MSTVNQKDINKNVFLGELVCVDVCYKHIMMY